MVKGRLGGPGPRRADGKQEGEREREREREREKSMMRAC